jgi:hypothetical protein
VSYVYGANGIIGVTAVACLVALQRMLG